MNAGTASTCPEDFRIFGLPHACAEQGDVPEEKTTTALETKRATAAHPLRRPAMYDSGLALVLRKQLDNPTLASALDLDEFSLSTVRAEMKEFYTESGPRVQALVQVGHASPMLACGAEIVVIVHSQLRCVALCCVASCQCMLWIPLGIMRASFSCCLRVAESKECGTAGGNEALHASGQRRRWEAVSGRMGSEIRRRHYV